MGIDVYLRWNGQTAAEAEAQFTGFSIVSGNVGYLHEEAYHGDPYATAVLIDRNWNMQPAGGFVITARELRDRLPIAVLAALVRQKRHYGLGATSTEIENLAKAADLCYKKNARFIMTPELLDAAKAVIETGDLPDMTKSFVDFVLLAERKETETSAPCTVYVVSF